MQKRATDATMRWSAVCATNTINKSNINNKDSNTTKTIIKLFPFIRVYSKANHRESNTTEKQSNQTRHYG